MLLIIPRTRILLALAEASLETQAPQVLLLYQMNRPHPIASLEKGRAFMVYGDRYTVVGYGPLLKNHLI
jgi:hypothetical protein